MNLLLNELTQDEYLVSVKDYVPSAWIGHTPFLKFLIREQKPKVFVELGVHNGFSYFVACQSIRECRLETSAFAVDHWFGDEQAGNYGESVYAGVASMNVKYSDFSKLLRMSFQDALEYFPDASIDLLHIDGFHSYESVKNDFESWLVKMTNNGIILLHDIHVRKKSFGVFEFWKEIKANFKTMELTGAHGLGVVFLDEIYSGKLKKVFEIANSNESTQLQGTFGSLSDNVLQNFRTEEFQRLLAERNQAIAERNQAIAERNQAIAERNQAIAERNLIVKSRTWRIFKFYRKLRSAD